MTAAPPMAVVETAPLSPGQERLIADEFALPSGEWPEPGSPTRMRPIDTGAVHIAGHLDVAALRRALDGLIRRQAALRTTFRQLSDGTPLQIVLRHTTVPFTDCTLPIPGTADLPPGVELLRHAGPAAADPRHGSLFRAHLIRMDPDRHLLLLQIHHLISDGWSIGVLYRELSALYNAEVTGADPGLPVLHRSFASFCREMRADRAGAAHNRQLRYWQTRLAPPLTSPPVFRGAAPTNPVDVELMNVEPDDVAGLRAAAGGALRRGGLAGGFLAALAMVLHYATGATDIRIGMMIANRARPDAEHLVGYFVNTAVIRLCVTPETTAVRLVTAASLAVTEAIENQAVPIQDVVRNLRETGALGADPLYRVTVALNTMRSRSLTLHDLDCQDLDVDPSGPRQAPTSIAQRWVLEERDGGLTGTLTYRTDTIGRRSAVAIRTNLERAMRAVTDRQATTAGIAAEFDPAARAPR